MKLQIKLLFLKFYLKNAQIQTCMTLFLSNLNDLSVEFLEKSPKNPVKNPFQGVLMEAATRQKVLGL